MTGIRKILNFICTALVLMCLWFIMSQKTEPKFLILGAASSLIISALCLRTMTMKGCRTEKEYFLPAVNLIRFPVYFVWLMIQIIKSAIYVAVRSMKGAASLSPSVVWFRADYDNPAARAMLANSITLTPGTVTIDITEDGIYSVHALTDELKDGLLDGSMQEKVAWLYGETISFSPVAAEISDEETDRVNVRYKAKRRGSR